MPTHLTLALVALLALVPLAACSSDTDPASAVFFTLVVENESGINIDIFIDDTTDATGFVAQGTVLRGESLPIETLVVGVEYTLRVAMAGLDADAFFTEEAILGQDDSTLTLPIGPPSP